MNVDRALKRALSVTDSLADPSESVHLGDEVGNVLWTIAFLLPADRRDEVLRLLPLLRDLCLARMREAPDRSVEVEVLGERFERAPTEDPIEASTWLAGVAASDLLDDHGALAMFLAYDGELGEVMGPWEPALARAVRAQRRDRRAAGEITREAQAAARALGLAGDREDVRMAERALSLLALGLADQPGTAWRVAPQMIDADGTEVGLAFLGLGRRRVQAGEVLPERSLIGGWLVTR